MYAETLSASARRFSYHAPGDLPLTARDAIWALVGEAIRTRRDEFEQGLFKMDEIWLMEVGGEIKGFGGVRLFYPEWQGRKATVIFTGRVFLDPSIRGNNVLQTVGVRYYWKCLKAKPFQPVYWMFGAGSFKSYLLLPRNFKTYWPQPSATLPERERALLHEVARALDNPLYNPDTGIMSHPELIYLDGRIQGNPTDLTDPDIAFYARINPGQAQGDDVMCLCPLTPRNWLSCLGKAMLRVVR